MVKQLSTIFAAHLSFKREIAQQFNNLRHVVVIFCEQLSLTLWIEEVLCCEQFETLNASRIPINTISERCQIEEAHHAGQAPNIYSSIPVTPTDDRLGGTILPCLNIFREVTFAWGCITQISYLNRYRRRVYAGLQRR
jgi:hypothetical protein